MEYIGKHRKEMLTDVEIRPRQLHAVEDDAEQLMTADITIEIDADFRLDDMTRAAMKHNLVVFAESMVGFSMSNHIPLRLDSPLLIWDESGAPLDAHHIDIYVARDEDGNAKGFVLDFSSQDFSGLMGDADKDAHLNSMLRRSLIVLARRDPNSEGNQQVFTSGIVPYNADLASPEQEISDDYLCLLHQIMEEDFKEIAEYGYSYGDRWIHVHNDEPRITY